MLKFTSILWLLNSSRKDQHFKKLQSRDKRLEFFLTFSLGFGVFKAYFHIKNFLIKKNVYLAEVQKEKKSAFPDTFISDTACCERRYQYISTLQMGASVKALLSKKYGLYSCLFYSYSKIEILINICCNRSFMHSFLYMKETAPLLVLSQRLINGFSFKELRNCISRIVRVWSLFCSLLVYTSLHSLAILLEN